MEWSGNSAVFKAYLEGRSDGDGKKPMHSPKMERYNLSFDEASKFECFGAVLNEGYIDISFDDKEMYEAFLDMAEAKDWKCLALPSSHGGHTYWKNAGRITKGGKDKKLAVGLIADVHSGGTYIPLCVHGVKRFPPDYTPYEDEQIDEVPDELLPIRTNAALWRMENGEGRNQELFNYILSLQTAGFDVESARNVIRTANRFILKDPLPDNELETVLRDEAFQKPVFYKGSTFLFDKFAQYLVSQLHIMRINNQLHIYRDGVYVSGYGRIESEMIKLIPDLKRVHRREVLDYLEILCAENHDSIEPTLIAFRNGLLDLRTMEIMPFSPEHIITNRIDWDYNPNAYNETLDDTLNKIACHDDQIRSLLEEAAGYTMYRRNELGKAFILTGTGSNGKSTYLSVLRNMLGKQNISSLDMKMLSDRFSTVMMFGKLANIGDDISDEFVADTSIFKKIVTGETIGAEQKGQPKFEFEPYCKLFFSANNIPRMGKGRDWDAIKRRLVIIPFGAKFTKNDPDYKPFIIDDLKTQESMEYMIKLGVDGLKRVLHSKEFTQSVKVDKEVDDYEEGNNPVLAFIRECEETDYSIENNETKESYLKYVGFCADSGLKEMSQIEFSRAICRRLGLVTVTKTKKGKGKVRVFERRCDS